MDPDKAKVESILKPLKEQYKTDRALQLKKNRADLSKDFFGTQQKWRSSLVSEASKKNVTLDGPKLTYMMNWMGDEGYSEEEVLERFVYLPERLKEVYLHSYRDPEDILTRNDEDYISSLGEKVWKKWGYVRLKDEKKINAQIKKADTKYKSFDHAIQTEIEIIKQELSDERKLSKDPIAIEWARWRLGLGGWQSKTSNKLSLIHI